MSVDVFGRQLTRGAVKRGSVGVQGAPSKKIDMALNANARKEVQVIVKNEIESLQMSATILSASIGENIEKVIKLEGIFGNFIEQNDRKIANIQNLLKDQNIIIDKTDKHGAKISKLESLVDSLKEDYTKKITTMQDRINNDIGALKVKTTTLATNADRDFRKILKLEGEFNKRILKLEDIDKHQTARIDRLELLENRIIYLEARVGANINP